MFKFHGSLEASKSWMNRVLIIQQYNREISIQGQSSSTDVQHMRSALNDFTLDKREFNVGEGGTTLRFFSFFVSRNSGVWTIKGSPRLLQRPQDDLQKILQQLKVDVGQTASEIRIESDGWVIPDVLECSGATSSQFISGLLLNCWNLEKDLRMKIKKPLVSEDYLKMSERLLQKFGMSFQKTEDERFIFYNVNADQKPASLKNVTAEVDVSSAFALAAAAVVDGDVEIHNWQIAFDQPDFIFLEILKKMNINFKSGDSRFEIKKQVSWKGLEFNLVNSPDLFPVLSVLCALASGSSYLYGAAHLKAKESDRINKTKELLQLCGYNCEVRNDGLAIEGQSSAPESNSIIKFDPDQDHRMAMAAGLLKLAGFKIEISDSQVVSKSYSDFWDHIQVKP